ncbi:sigma factor [Nonomuraea angiospora]|uniref:sigma factor n=1 Tax=Nonomuraea angiospora TaxID=46172 RepID=UPI003416DAD1
MLFTVACEMLGSAADAEDVFQKAWLWWVKADLAQMRDQRAYLVRITTRQALTRSEFAAVCPAQKGIFGADSVLPPRQPSQTNFT